MLNAPSTPEIVTRGDLAGNVESFARHGRSASLTPATQHTYLVILDRLATCLESWRCSQAGSSDEASALARVSRGGSLSNADSLASAMARMVPIASIGACRESAIS